MRRLTKLYKHLIPPQVLTHVVASHCHSQHKKPQLVLMTSRVIGKQFISLKKKNKGNVNITRSMPKMPLGTFPLWLYSLFHFQLLFSPSFSMSNCQNDFDLRNMLLSPLVTPTKLPPATGRQLHRNPLILSSLWSVSVLGPPGQGGSWAQKIIDATGKKSISMRTYQWDRKNLKPFVFSEPRDHSFLDFLF